ncbi:MAG: 23S rRNA (pseudouridine(1915)-N(3))-methyltransferase RlmH [Parachlamydiaceae bacterium]
MYRIRILSVGKTKEEWLEEAISEYLKRLQKITTIEFVWAKDDEHLSQLVGKEAAKGGIVLCLDPKGQSFTSEKFSTYFLKQLELGGARAALVIGGADGLPPELKNEYPLFSLSAMTFTHQITRLILIEQIYRAFEIAKGSRYNK